MFEITIKLLNEYIIGKQRKNYFTTMYELYQDNQQQMIVCPVPEKWRCVFATQDYKEWDTIEICEFISIPKEQVEVLKKTIINDYWFGINWETDNVFLLLWYGSLYNHRKDWNMTVVEDRWKVWFVAKKDIKKRQELTFDYWYELHFKAIPPMEIERIIKWNENEK